MDAVSALLLLVIALRETQSCKLKPRTKTVLVKSRRCYSIVNGDLPVPVRDLKGWYVWLSLGLSVTEVHTQRD